MFTHTQTHRQKHAGADTRETYIFIHICEMHFREMQLWDTSNSIHVYSLYISIYVMYVHHKVAMGKINNIFLSLIDEI